MYKSFLRNINADCNSAISVRSIGRDNFANREHKLLFQVFGKNEFFSTEKADKDPQKVVKLAIEEFDRNNAQKLLNEHN
jgi:porphobilinogen deaminase